jgi:hypothetical protein
VFPVTLLEHAPVLLGPSDADHFRVKVGRYGDRWYTDPLPACDIAEASEWVGPSVSTTKPPFANKYVPMRSIADMPSDEWQRLSSKDADERYEAIKLYEKSASRINMDRGSIVHRYAEDRLFGRATIEQFLPGSPKALEQAQRFRPALDAFFDTYQPELVVAEAVCLHRTLNGVGYGGTTDAIIRVERDLWDVDWKSRNSDHAAYDDEAGQGGAYIGAEYMIVTGPDGNPMRAPIPAVAGVLIVSIREDGFRVYPIDRDGAIAHYEAMHRWWCAQQELTKNKVIGRPWATKAAKSQPLPTDRRAVLRARYQAMSDDEKFAYMDLHVDPDNLDAVEAALDKVDRFNVTCEMPPLLKVEVPKLETPPDEGGSVADTDVRALEERFKRLPIDASLWTGRLVAEGNKAFPFRIKDKPTERRYWLYRGILALCEAGPDWANDDTLTGLIDGIAPVQTDTVGGMLAHMDHCEAAAFAARVREYLAATTQENRK